ncbi:hypothetical protein WA158_005619 [Blastocystis sp. Blastoise]
MECEYPYYLLSVRVNAPQSNFTLNDASYQFLYKKMVIALETELSVGNNGQGLIEACAPAGSYTWRLKAKSSNWDQGVYLSLIIEDEYIIKGRILDSKTFDIPFTFPLTIQKSKYWYYANVSSLPYLDWYKRALPLGYHPFINIYPHYNNHPTRFFMNQFTISTLSKVRTILIGLKGQGGFIIYINEKEVNRLYLPDIVTEDTYGLKNELNDYYYHMCLRFFQTMKH